MAGVGLRVFYFISGLPGVFIGGIDAHAAPLASCRTVDYSGGCKYFYSSQREAKRALALGGRGVVGIRLVSQVGWIGRQEGAIAGEPRYGAMVDVVTDPSRRFAADKQISVVFAGLEDRGKILVPSLRAHRNAVYYVVYGNPYKSHIWLFGTRSSAQELSQNQIELFRDLEQNYRDLTSRVPTRRPR